jgi:hypothetical protein
MVPNRAVIAILAILLLVSSVSARPLSGNPLQSSDGVFFPDTGYWVRGEFLAFYKAAPDAQRLFGRPISDSMPDPMRPGMQVQYFERARLDFDAAKPAGKRISLGNLGQNLRDESNPGEALNFSTNTNMCRAFSNGRLVCYAFLQFYDRYNGAVYFGQPLSNTEYLDGRLVQYFERARMEWRADRPVGERVVLTELGRIDFDIRIGRNNITSGRLELSADTFISSPVVAAGQEQHVFVVVHDQRHDPVEGASVIITATYPDGHAESIRTQQGTNADGFSQASFIVKNVQPNQVITITATAEVTGGAKASGSTWFRIWW